MTLIPLQLTMRPVSSLVFPAFCCTMCVNKQSACCTPHCRVYATHHPRRQCLTHTDTMKINITTSKQEVGGSNKWTKDRCSGSAAARAVTGNKYTTTLLKCFSMPVVRLKSTFSCSTAANMTGMFSVALGKVIAAVVIHFPICPANSAVLYSSAFTPPPQRVNERVCKKWKNKSVRDALQSI